MGGGFIPSMLVETDTGPRAIESIAVGDYVLSIGPRSEQCAYARVRHVIRHAAQLLHTG